MTLSPDFGSNSSLYRIEYQSQEEWTIRLAQDTPFIETSSLAAELLTVVCSLKYDKALVTRYLV
jgi:hypothetical protein